MKLNQANDFSFIFFYIPKSRNLLEEFRILVSYKRNFVNRCTCSNRGDELIKQADPDFPARFSRLPEQSPTS